MASPYVANTDQLTANLMQLIQGNKQMDREDQLRQQALKRDQDQKKLVEASAQALALRELPTLEQKKTGLYRLAQSAIKQGGDPEAWERIAGIENIDEMNVALRQMAINTETASKFISDQGRKSDVQFGAQQTFKDESGNLFFGTTKRNPATGTVDSVLAPLGSGPKSPVGKVSLVSNLGQTVDEKVQTEVDKASKVEAAKLGAQFKLKPQVEAAVATAVGQAKAEIDIAGENRSNEIALNMYETATKGLVDALSDTETGPFVGFLPALTTNQQVAEGAVAAMAPILKQLFRGAGEGTFTDKDQELLLEMLPTRKDRAEARLAKLSNIDAIIRAKLAPLKGQPTQSTTGDVISEADAILGL